MSNKFKYYRVTDGILIGAKYWSRNDTMRSDAYPDNQIEDLLKQGKIQAVPTTPGVEAAAQTTRKQTGRAADYAVTSGDVGLGPDDEPAEEEDSDLADTRSEDAPVRRQSGRQRTANKAK